MPLTRAFVTKRRGRGGVEPSCSKAAGFKPAVSTDFTTRPSWTLWGFLAPWWVPPRLW